MFGGALAAGPRPDGGYRVRAVLRAEAVPGLPAQAESRPHPGAEDAAETSRGTVREGLVDALLAVAATAVLVSSAFIDDPSVAHDYPAPTATLILLLLGCSLPLAGRRRWPLLVCVVTTVSARSRHHPCSRTAAPIGSQRRTSPATFPGSGLAGAATSTASTPARPPRTSTPPATSGNAGPVGCATQSAARAFPGATDQRRDQHPHHPPRPRRGDVLPALARSSEGRPRRRPLPGRPGSSSPPARPLGTSATTCPSGATSALSCDEDTRSVHGLGGCWRRTRGDRRWRG